MVSHTASMEIVTTHTEAEALLLEANLIKRLKPRYNIVLRDDKSYPWLMLTEEHAFPQIAKFRGTQVKGRSYWGPFASAWAVNQTVVAMERVFLLRSCADTVFRNRSRPCLLHQIKRCSAPCVGRIEPDAYAKLVAQAKAFLQGRAAGVQAELAAEMEAASENLEFERAAAARDRIRALTHVQGTGVVNPASLEDADVIAAWQTAGQTCVQVFFVRGGRNNGNRAFYPTHGKQEDAGEVLEAFIAQFYDDKAPPPLLLTSHDLPQSELVAEALCLKAHRKVEITTPQRGEKKAVVEHAITNAREALERRLAEGAGHAKLLEGVAQLFELGGPTGADRVLRQQPHHGHQPVWRDGGVRAGRAEQERLPQIQHPQRDHARRRFRDDAGGAGAPLRPRPPRAGRGRCEQLARSGADRRRCGPALRGPWLSAARGVLADLGVQDVKLVGIAKGPDRDAGREWFHIDGRDPFQLPPRDPVLYYLQRVRDEAHRFAITTHRAGRSKTLVTSELDEIDGVGSARKRALLNHFGSARGVKRAGRAGRFGGCSGDQPGDWRDGSTGTSTRASGHGGDHRLGAAW